MMRIRKLMAAACAAIAIACAAAGTGVRADAYVREPAVIEVDSLDRIPDGYDASRSDVAYVLALCV